MWWLSCMWRFKHEDCHNLLSCDFFFASSGCWFKSFVYAAQCHVVNTDSNCCKRHRQSCDFEDQLNEVQMDRFLNWRTSNHSLWVSRWQITAEVMERNPSGRSEEEGGDEDFWALRSSEPECGDLWVHFRLTQKWKFA